MSKVYFLSEGALLRADDASRAPSAVLFKDGWRPFILRPSEVDTLQRLDEVDAKAWADSHGLQHFA